MKQGTWIKMESAKDSAVTWGDDRHIDPPKLSFLIKAVYDVLPTPVNLHIRMLTSSDRCRTCRKTSSLKHILIRCEFALSYTEKHYKVIENFAEAENICCETANKAQNDITNRAIDFVKEGSISKLSCKNKHRSSLLDGCTNKHVVTDLEHNFVFPTERPITTHPPDIVIWFVKLRKKVLFLS